MLDRRLGPAVVAALIGTFTVLQAATPALADRDDHRWHQHQRADRDDYRWYHNRDRDDHRYYHSTPNANYYTNGNAYNYVNPNWYVNNAYAYPYSVGTPYGNNGYHNGWYRHHRHLLDRDDRGRWHDRR
ncbi:MAG: hypothetical protein JO103_11295 [Candidatus Eremiobacteraeota bacterium]|nr:hypothetical protein [Candidatus Eremiobacteraeota bacterium]